MDSALRLEYLPLAELLPATRNPKKHDLVSLKQAMKRRGFMDPALYDERTGRLIEGHGRRQALLELEEEGEAPPRGVIDGTKGWAMPILRGWASKDDIEAEAALVAMNQLTIAGGWDIEGLTAILVDLKGTPELDALGFTGKELDALLDSTVGTSGNTDPDEVPVVAEEEVLVRLGDVYQLGDHRLACGSSTEPAVIDRLMQGELAHICWTDPPWNVAYGEREQSEKHARIANDDLGEDFPQFLAQAFAETARVLEPGAMVYVAMAGSEWGTLMSTLKQLEYRWSSTIIWAKDSFTLQRSDYHRQYEPIWYGWKDGAPRLCPLEDRKQSDLWNIPRPKKSDEHPTMKPVELVVRSLKNSSHHGNVVFEPFSGSGTTLLASEMTGRHCRAIELDPRYVQVAIKRWEAFTGRKAERIYREPSV
jgi:DNA modification methylase